MSKPEVKEMDTKHTPGPWVNIGNCRIHGTPAYPGIDAVCDGAEWQGVPPNSLHEVCVAFPAQVYGYSKNGKEYPVRKDVQERWWARNKANIALICAAPDMLEALRAAKELADVMEGLCSGRSDDEWVWAAQEKINAAIAKAEGQYHDH